MTACHFECKVPLMHTQDRFIPAAASIRATMPFKHPPTAPTPAYPPLPQPTLWLLGILHFLVCMPTASATAHIHLTKAESPDDIQWVKPRTPGAGWDCTCRTEWDMAGIADIGEGRRAARRTVVQRGIGGGGEGGGGMGCFRRGRR